MQRSAILLAIFVGLAGCGKGAGDIPPKPQIKPDRQAVDFGQSTGTGTYVGTSASDSLQLLNQGNEDLVIKSADLSGDPAFTLVGPDVSTVPWGTSALITLYFKPPAAGKYSATLTITSNAENAPTEQIAVSGLAIDPPDGGI